MIPAVRSHVDHRERCAVITTDFDHPVDVVWTLFSDPAKLARWWGPPGVPMTVDHHDLRPGGTVDITVTLQDAVIRGRWTIRQVDAPHHLAFTFQSDGLEPTQISVAITSVTETSATMSVTARFATDELLRHALDIDFASAVARSCATAIEALGN